MEENKNPEQTQTQESHTDPQVSSGKPPKRHLVRPTWLRRTLKTRLRIGGDYVVARAFVYSAGADGC